MMEFDHGDGIEVMLGGGRAAFMAAGAALDPEYGQPAGMRADQRNLAEEWAGRLGADHHYVWNAGQLNGVSADGQVLGLFEPSHMQYEADRNRTDEGEPSIAEMTRFSH